MERCSASSAYLDQFTIRVERETPRKEGVIGNIKTKLGTVTSF